MATNLNEYYKSIGQSLPSVGARAPIFEQYGLGSAGSYSGTAQQNTSLLQRLQSGAPQSITAQVQPSQQVGGTPYDQIDFTKQASAGQAEADYLSYLRGIENPLDTYNKAVTSLGIPDVRASVQSLRKQILDSENLLNQVEGSVTGRTQGSLVTEAQRQRLVAQERQPIAEQAQKSYGALGTESANLQDLLGQATNQVSLAQQGFQQKAEPLRTRFESATSREAEERRRVEADRLYQEQIRQYNATLAASKASTAKAKAPSPVTELTSDIKELLKKLPQISTPFETERFLNEAYGKYPELSQSEINNLTYSMRKNAGLG